MSNRANRELAEFCEALATSAARLVPIREELSKHQRYEDKFLANAKSSTAPEDIAKTFQQIQHNALSELNQKAAFIADAFANRLPAFVADWVKRIDVFEDKLRVTKSQFDFGDAEEEYEKLSDDWTLLWSAMSKTAREIIENVSFSG